MAEFLMYFAGFFQGLVIGIALSPGLTKRGTVAVILMEVIALGLLFFVTMSGGK